MSGASASFAVFPGGDRRGVTGRTPARQFQELWFSIVRKPWASLVLVPAGEGASVADVATELADVGTRLRDTPVNAIVAESLDFDSVRVLSGLHRLTLDSQPAWNSAEDVEARPQPVPGDARGREPASQSLRQATAMPPLGRVLVAIRSVIDEPLGVGVAQAADGVVLRVELGVTRLASVRRTIQMIGAERILGAFLLRSGTRRGA